MIKKIVLLSLFAMSLTMSRAYAQDARALYTETNLGGGTWRYNYTFYNDLSSISFAGFDLYDVSLTLDGATTAMNEMEAPNWSSIITMDFVEYFSVLSGPPPAGSDLPLGASLGGFQFIVNKQLGDVPFVATFTNPSDPLNPQIYVGTSSAMISAPEPMTLSLLATGILGLGLVPQRKYGRLKNR
jgi:hypothetical protein